MFNRLNVWRNTAGATLTLGLLASSALAQVAPTTPSAPPAAPDPMPPNGKSVTAPAALAPALAAYKSVTADRLTKPDDGDWLMFRRTYNGWGYSPFNQITTANASHLHPVWSMATGQIKRPPGAADRQQWRHVRGEPGNQVLAVNAKTGDLLWRFKRPIPEDQFLLHPTSRGVALWGDKVFFAASDAVLVALDAKTGKEVWNAKVEDYTKGYYMSLAPLVIGGKVLVGTSGGELGVRGFVVAFDAESGKELWRTFTVPAPGEAGSETWPKGDQWKTGGGSIWVTGVYDSATGLTFWGTGNGGPWMGDQRPGRQPLHVLGPRARCEDRPDQGVSSSSIRIIRGTGTRCHRPNHRQLHEQRKAGEGSRRCRSRWVSLDARAHLRQDQLRCRSAICLPRHVHRR